MCFSLTNTASFSNVKSKWFPEVMHYEPEAPIILVGTKSDARDDEKVVEALKQKGKDVVTTEQGQALAKDIGAAAYVECSALTQEKLTDVFSEAIRASLKKQEKAKEVASCKCVIM